MQFYCICFDTQSWNLTQSISLVTLLTEQRFPFSLKFTGGRLLLHFTGSQLEILFCQRQPGSLTAAIRETISLPGGWAQSDQWPCWRRGTNGDKYLDLKDVDVVEHEINKRLYLIYAICVAVAMDVSLGVLKDYFLSKSRPQHSERDRACYTGIKLQNPGILGKNHGNQLI